MPGNRRLNCCLGRFLITDLANHHHVRVEAQHTTQPIIKPLASRRINRDLRNAGNGIFYWVFQCNHFTIRRIERIENAVQSR